MSDLRKVTLQAGLLVLFASDLSANSVATACEITFLEPNIVYQKEPACGEVPHTEDLAECKMTFTTAEAQTCLGQQFPLPMVPLGSCNANLMGTSIL